MFVQHLLDIQIFCINVELGRKEIVLVDYPLQIELFGYMLVSTF